MFRETLIQKTPPEDKNGNVSMFKYQNTLKSPKTRHHKCVAYREIIFKLESITKQKKDQTHQGDYTKSRFNLTDK